MRLDPFQDLGAFMQDDRLAIILRRGTDKRRPKENKKTTGREGNPPGRFFLPGFDICCNWHNICLQ